MWYTVKINDEIVATVRENEKIVSVPLILVHAATEVIKERKRNVKAPIYPSKAAASKHGSPQSRKVSHKSQ